MFKRSSKDKVIGGVCGGLGKVFETDPLIFRLIFVISFLGFGTGAIPYLIIWLLAAEE